MPEQPAEQEWWKNRDGEERRRYAIELWINQSRLLWNRVQTALVLEGVTAVFWCKGYLWHSRLAYLSAALCILAQVVILGMIERDANVMDEMRSIAAITKPRGGIPARLFAVALVGLAILANVVFIALTKWRFG